MWEMRFLFLLVVIAHGLAWNNIKLWDVLLYELTKCRNRQILHLDLANRSESHCCWTACQFQININLLIPNLAASNQHETIR